MKNNRTLLISLIAVVALFIGAIIFIPQLTKKSDGDQSTVSTNVDLSKYDLNKVIPASDDNGGIADHVKGDLETAKIVLFEYADYQCSACALFQSWLEELVKEYDGELAVVFRTYPLTSIHPSAIAAASAVEAAGLQGYWAEMGDLLFANQAEWSAAKNVASRTEYFVNYFTTVSRGKGDVDKFKSDLAGDSVKAKVYFDKAIAESFKLTATPSFMDSEGNEIDFTEGVEQTKSGIMNFFRNYLNKKLNK